MGKKKKFIDKKNAVTFRLVHRSQRDPLVTDENAPQHVLQAIDGKKGSDTKEEMHKFGIYYDDNYDYLQHLKQRTGQGELLEVREAINTKKKKSSKGISLPSSVFQSSVEEKIGVLNKAAPQSGLNLDLDPDIVAAMDDDFDYSDPENMLDDDFLAIANAPLESDDDYSEVESNDAFSNEYDDEVRSLEGFETKSRFTDYSMSSSIMRRNEHLTMLDDRFEEMFKEYDDDEIGALDTEEIEGYIGPRDEMINKFIDDFDQLNKKIEIIPQRKPIIFDESDSSSSENNYEYVELKPKEKWDCESILSTYSTLYNHPKLISAPPSKIRINNKGIPVNKNKLTASALVKLGLSESNRATGPGSIASAISLLSIRPKDESPAERKNRKLAFRGHKKERRAERKLNSEAFKDEKIRMEKMMARNKSKFQVAL